MSNKDMKMRIAIEGDNKGFKRSLNQTERDMKQFETRQSSGVADLLAAGSVFAGGAGARKLLLGNMAKYTGIKGGTADARGYGMQALAGGVLGNPNLRKWESTHRRRLNKNNARIAKNSGIREDMNGRFDDTRKGRAAFRARNQSAGFLKGLEVASAIRMALPVVAPVIAVAAAAAAKSISNQNKFDAAAGEFSGAVIGEKARIEVEELQRAIQRSKDSGLAASSTFAARSDQALSRAGTSTTGRNVAQDLWSVIKSGTAGAVNVAGSAMTQEGAFAAYGGLGVAGGLAYFSNQFYRGTQGKGIN